MTQPTDEDLQRLSSRLLHDVQVFFHVGRTLLRWQLGITPAMTWEVRTALVESFAMHARGLRDFFHQRGRGRFEDNAFAFDFFEQNYWINSLAPPEGPWLQRIKLVDPSNRIDRFGKEMGHFVFEPDQEPLSAHLEGWPISQLAHEIGAVLRVFIAEVDDAKVAPDFKAKAEREVPLVARLGHAPAGAGVWARPVMARARREAR